MQMMRLFLVFFSFPIFFSNQKFPLLHAWNRERKGTCFHNTQVLNLRETAPSCNFGVFYFHTVQISWQNKGMLFYLRPNCFLKWSLEDLGLWSTCFLQVDMLVSQYHCKFFLNVDLHIDVIQVYKSSETGWKNNKPSWVTCLDHSKWFAYYPFYNKSQTKETNVSFTKCCNNDCRVFLSNFIACVPSFQNELSGL